MLHLRLKVEIDDYRKYSILFRQSFSIISIMRSNVPLEEGIAVKRIPIN